MKRYVALFFSFLLVFSTRPVFAGFIDTLKGLIPGHHAERSKPEVHHSHRARPAGNKQDQPGESPSPNPEASPGPGESPGPSPVAVQTAEPNTDNNQSAGVDQSARPVSSPIVLQNSTTGAPSVAIDPPPLY
jgi:hypothetical protein